MAAASARLETRSLRSSAAVIRLTVRSETCSSSATSTVLMWLAAIEQLKEDGLEDMPVPDAFPDSGEFTDEFGYTYLGFSSGTDAAQGRWASGPAPDGRGEFRYDDNPRANAPEPVLPPGDPRLYGTNPGMAGSAVDTVTSKLT